MCHHPQCNTVNLFTQSELPLPLQGLIQWVFLILSVPSPNPPDLSWFSYLVPIPSLSSPNLHWKWSLALCQDTFYLLNSAGPSHTKSIPSTQQDLPTHSVLYQEPHIYKPRSLCLTSLHQNHFKPLNTRNTNILASTPTCTVYISLRIEKKKATWIDLMTKILKIWKIKPVTSL